MNRSKRYINIQFQFRYENQTRVDAELDIRNVYGDTSGFELYKNVQLFLSIIQAGVI